MHTHFKGLIAAPFTPFNHEGKTINLEMIPRLANSLKANRVKGAFICGSTGEGVSLSMNEKKQVMEGWAKEQEPDFSIIMLVASNSLQEAKELARFANDVRLYGLAILPPFYFKLNSVSVLAEFCAEIAAEVPRKPIYYYHIPALSGVNFPMLDLLTKVEGITNFAGIKYTAPDLEDFRKCMIYGGGKYDIMWGIDEFLLGALAMGAKAGVGSTYNYMAPLYNELITAFDSGDKEEARRLQDKSIEVIGLLKKYGGIGTGKAFMKAIGLDCGEFRRPVESVTDMESFQRDLKRVDFFTFSSGISLNAKL